MKVEELMVGDWVNVNAQTPVRMITYDIDKVVVAQDENSLCITCSFNQLSPILITPQILKKNNFTFHSDDSIIPYEWWENKDKTIIINKYSNTVGKDWCVHIDNKDFQSIGSADIQYIHELQHLLKLCGINKEITL